MEIEKFHQAQELQICLANIEKEKEIIEKFINKSDDFDIKWFIDNLNFVLGSKKTYQMINENMVKHLKDELKEILNILLVQIEVVNNKFNNL